MKPLTAMEVEGLAAELRQWAGAQLQEIQIAGGPKKEPQSMRLGFFMPGGVRWVVIDYLVSAPQLIVFGKPSAEVELPRVQRIRRPIELFVRSKFIGRRLRTVATHPEEGRALDLIFDSGELGELAAIEIKLYPHGRNVIARFGEKSVSEFKPMPPSEFKARESIETVVRSPRDLLAEWLGGRESQVPKSADGMISASKQTDALSLQIAKKEKALDKVRAEILLKQSAPQRAMGEWIKENQSLEVPAEWREHIDAKKSLAANIERLFKEAKATEAKISGTRARAQALETEIAKLKAKLETGEQGSQPLEVSRPKGLLERSEARGRKMEIAPDLTVFIGKSAGENLAILRKAQPFDYWLHLRDRPGAHAIISRARGRNVTDAEFAAAGKFVAEQTLKKRASELHGEKFDLLIVECRFVRPIKGDKLGRVHYTNDRVLRLRF